MSNKQPAYIAFHVADRGENKKGFWTQIGAAWNHEDDNGLTLQLELTPAQLELIPPNGGKIVLRKYDPREHSES